MIKNILFDLDGVLVEAKEWHYKALNLALKDFINYEISLEDHLTKFDGLPTRVKLKMIDKNIIKISKETQEKIFKLKQHYTMNLIASHCKPNEKMIETMHKLQDYKKACVTNSIYKTAYEMLVHAGLNYYMDYVQGNEATPFPKPNPAPYLMAMSKMGILPIETLVIEDNEKGIKSATDSGAHVLSVLNSIEVNYENIIRRIREINEYSNSNGR
jgi:beta-phosphoglucomutase